MKKLILAILIALTVAAFASCDHVDDILQSLSEAAGEMDPVTSGGSEDIVSDTGGIDLDDILGGESTVGSVIAGLDDEYKRLLIEQAKAEGAEITFGADGSTIIKDKDGNVMIQKPDGTWTYSDESGATGQYGGNWPDNEYTKLLPKPDFDLLAAGTDSQQFTASFAGVTVEKIKDYAAKVKNAGFSVDAQDEDYNYGELLMYTFTAYNSDGYCVELFFSAGVSGITLSKPEQ